MCRGASIPYFKINAPIFGCSIFFEECFNPQVRINKMVSEHTFDYHPRPSELTSRINPLIILLTTKGFIFPEYFLNFFSYLYIPPLMRKSFKFMVFILLENTFMSQKLNLFIFTHAPRENSSPGSYYHHSRQKRNYPLSPNKVF